MKIRFIVWVGLLAIVGFAGSGFAATGPDRAELDPVAQEAQVGATDLLLDSESAAETKRAGGTAIAGAPRVRLVIFDTIVTEFTVKRIMNAIDDAEREGDEFVLIEIDTPGGELRFTQDLVKRMLNAKVPIVAWVGPSGAAAASAGFFILQASDYIAMAPGTRTGAAAAVFSFGPNQQDDVLLEKVNEDSAASLRSIATQRGRNAEAAAATVMDKKSYEETAALELGVIDSVVDSREALLSLLDGRSVRRFDGSETILRTRSATFVTSVLSPKDRFMEVLSNPLLIGLLLSGGLLGLYVEFSQPGAIFPGVAGALCLVLFFMASRVMPVSWVGVLLVILALGMFVLEVKIPSMGALTVGGAATMGLGLWMLVDSPIPAFRISPAAILILVLFVSLTCFVVMRFGLRAQQARVTSGKEGLIGLTARVTAELAPTGKVFVRGEIWNARTKGDSLTIGAQVIVKEVQDLLLIVEAESVGGERSSSDPG